MDVDPEFNLEIVKDFIVSRLGKVTNHELVSHFKPFLSNPEKKAINREKFKDFVNTLASVKEEDGEKVLVLKKKFRKGTALASEPSSGKRDKKKKGQTSTDEGAAAPDAEAVSPTPGLAESESSSSISMTKDEPDKGSSEEYKPEESITIPEDSIQVQKSRQDEPVSPQATATEPEIDKKQELTPPSVVLTKPSVSDEDEVEGANGALRIRIPSQNAGQERTVVLETPGESSTDPDDVFKKGSDMPDGLSRKDGEVIKPQNSPTGMSVKERAKHLNKIESDSNIHSSNVKMRKHTHGDRRDDDSSSVSSAGYAPMDEVDREWMVVSAAADYHPMHKLLNQKPELAKKRDFITSALHWAAKHGKPDVIKLLCGQQGVNINARSGYTPLHLAAMNGHEEIIELLVHGYSAEPNIRDYSGKKAKQYLRNSASSRTQQILQNRRSNSTNAISGPFRRSGSYSAKIHKSGYFGIHGMSAAIRNSWIAGSEGSHVGRVSRSPSMSPSPSPRSSPGPSPASQRKSSKLGRPPPPPVRPPQPPPRRKKSLPGSGTKSKRTPLTEASESNNVEPEVEQTESYNAQSQPPPDENHPPTPMPVLGEPVYPQRKAFLENPMEEIREEASDSEERFYEAPIEMSQTQNALNAPLLYDQRGEDNVNKENIAQDGKLSQTVGYFSMTDFIPEQNINEEMWPIKEENGEEYEERDDVAPADSSLDVRASLGIFGCYEGEEDEDPDHHDKHPLDAEEAIEKGPQNDEVAENGEPDLSGISFIERLVSASAKVYYEKQRQGESEDEQEYERGSAIKHENQDYGYDYGGVMQEDESTYDPEAMEFNPFLFGQDMLQRQVSETIFEEEEGEEEEENVIDYKFSEPFTGCGGGYSTDNVQDYQQDPMQYPLEMMTEDDEEEGEDEAMELVAPPRRRRSGHSQPAVEATPVVPPRRRKSQRLPSEATDEATEAKFSEKDAAMMPPPTAPSRKKKSRKEDKENNLPRPQSEPIMTLTRAASNPDLSSEARPPPSPVHTSPFV